MKIAVGSDHAGLRLKNLLRDRLREQGHAVEDLGTVSEESTDYPDFAVRVGRAVTGGEAERGLLVCGTGVGISIAANKVPGVRAAAVSEPVSARLARSHNDANVLCVGQRIVGEEMAEEIVRVFLDTPFSGGERHCRRIEKIVALENRQA
jgi:ribose 5-phosphate isomerase B